MITINTTLDFGAHIALWRNEGSGEHAKMRRLAEPSLLPYKVTMIDKDDNSG